MPIRIAEGEDMAQKSRYFRQGQLDFERSVSSDQNPYLQTGDNAKRQEWFSGWYHARIVKRLGHIFAKYNLTF
jgi:hypothetical protein